MRILPLLAALALLGLTACKPPVASPPSGPPSTDTSSAGLPDLRAKVEFLEKYVVFRRNYDALEFNLRFMNGGEGRGIGPSEWDIRLYARIPDSEIAAWVPPGGTAIPRPAPEQLQWLAEIPNTSDLGGVGEWYEAGQVTVGLDRSRGIVVYRNWAR
jgi:hypothetical protein